VQGLHLDACKPFPYSRLQIEIEEVGAVKISARNVLRGKVKAITRGDISAEVVIEVPGGVEIVSIATCRSIDDLKLEVGKEAFAVFEASSTMVAVPHSKRGE